MNNMLILNEPSCSVTTNEYFVDTHVYMSRSLECLIASLELLEQRKGWKRLQFETLLGIYEVLKCFLPREPSQLPVPLWAV